MTDPKLLTEQTYAGRSITDPSQVPGFKQYLERHVPAYTTKGTTTDTARAEKKSAIYTQLATIAANRITYMQDYILGLDPTDSTATITVQTPPSGDTSDSGITIVVPKVNPPSDSGYKVVYRVINKDTSATADYESASAVLLPLATGRYRVDAVIQPKSN